MKLCDLMKLLMTGQKVQLNFYSRNIDCLGCIAKYETEFESDMQLKYSKKHRKGGCYAITSVASEHFINDVDIANLIDVFIEELYQLRVLSIIADEVKCSGNLIINIVI